MGQCIQTPVAVQTRLMCPPRRYRFSAEQSRQAGQELVELMATRRGAVTPQIVRAYKELLDDCARLEGGAAK